MSEQGKLTHEQHLRLKMMGDHVLQFPLNIAHLQADMILILGSVEMPREICIFVGPVL